MKRIALAVALSAACASPHETVRIDATPKTRASVPAVKDPNFVLVVTEAVPNTDVDGVSYTKVFVDGREAGKTEVGRKSETRKLALKLPAGNQPVRLEHWLLPAVGEWTRLDDILQPRERFVRIEDGTIARLELRFAENEASNAVTLSREAASR